MTPEAMPNKVDFPDPFSPSTPWISPASQSSDTFDSACTVPNRFDTESMTRSGDLVELPLGTLSDRHPTASSDRLVRTRTRRQCRADQPDDAVTGDDHAGGNRRAEDDELERRGQAHHAEHRLEERQCEGSTPCRKGTGQAAGK